MSMAQCLRRLQDEGKMRPETAERLAAHHAGVMGDLLDHTSPITSDHLAALQVAEDAEAWARQKRASLQRQVLAEHAASQRVMAHPDGPRAGLMAEMVADLGERGSHNIESAADVIGRRLREPFSGALEAYSSKWAGLVQDTMGPRRAVEELYRPGSTGDETAAAAARGFTRSNEMGIARYQAAGGMVHAAADWRLPQQWSERQVRNTRKPVWVDDMTRRRAAGSITVLDRETGQPATDLQVPAILSGMYDQIALGRGGTSSEGGGVINSDMRVIKINDAATWLDLNDRYGGGRSGIFTSMHGHIDRMAREIAFVEKWGPNYQGTFRRLLAAVQQADVQPRRTIAEAMEEGLGAAADQTVAGAARLARHAIEGPAAAQRTFDLMTGRLDSIQSGFWAGLFGGLRHIQTAASLLSSVISAVPGDLSTALLAARHNGIPAMDLLRNIAHAAVLDSATAREEAASLHLIAHGTLDAALTVKRYDTEIVGKNLTGRLSSFLLRASYINRWTVGAKRGWEMSFSGLFARQADKTFAELDPAVRRMLSRYHFTAAEWDELRATPPVVVGGARYFDFSGAPNRELAERLLGAIIDERQHAVIEPGARVRQITTFGLQRGTIPGELMRSTFLFKSFSMAILATHMARMLAQPGIVGRGRYFGAMIASFTIGGAISLQLHQLLLGKTFQPMNDKKFWGRAILTGGALGIWGDFFNSAVAENGQTPLSALAGPNLGLADQAMRLLSSPYRNYMEGAKTNTGREVSNLLRRNVPGTTMWYARLALDRFIWDAIQEHLDPDYRKSFAALRRKAHQDFGQDYWFGPGDTKPRLPHGFGSLLPPRH